MALNLVTWVKKSTGIDVAEVSAGDFLDLVKWVGQGGELHVLATKEAPIVKINVNGETATVGQLIVKDGESFYITTESQLKEFYNKK